jgi:hypothetical protein
MVERFNRAETPLSGAFRSLVKERPGVRFRQTSIDFNRVPTFRRISESGQRKAGGPFRQTSTSEKPPTQGVAVRKDFESFL